jgi:hypothetical protein
MCSFLCEKDGGANKKDSGVMLGNAVAKINEGPHRYVVKYSECADRTLSETGHLRTLGDVDEWGIGTSLSHPPHCNLISIIRYEFCTSGITTEKIANR